MSTENSKTNESHKFIYQFTNKLNLKSPNNKSIGLVNLGIYYTWKNITSMYIYINICSHLEWWIWFAWWIIFNFRHSGLLWIYHQKHETLNENPPIQIYPNKIKNRIVFKIKAGYKLELLASEMMVLLGSAKKDVDKDKDGEDVPKLEPAEVVLIHCNLVNISYQQVSKVLFTFVPNKKFCQLITISPH